jgi:hypothetical protein
MLPNAYQIEYPIPSNSQIAPINPVVVASCHGQRAPSVLLLVCVESKLVLDNPKTVYQQNMDKNGSNPPLERSE